MGKQSNHNDKSRVNTHCKTRKHIVHVKHFQLDSSNECNTFFSMLIPAKLQEL